MSPLAAARDAGTWALLGVLFVGPGFGCEEAPADPVEGEDEGSEEAPVQPPAIVDPTGEVVVRAADREDITIQAADLLPTTRAELDGRSWSLSDAGPVIRAGQTVRVPLGGALVVGEHELVLVHYSGSKELRSEPLKIRVEAAELAPLDASLEPGGIGMGDRLIDAGPGERLLGVVDDAAGTIELRLGDWSAPGVVSSLPGLADGWGPAGAGIDVTLAELDAGRWVITTWLAEGGARVRARVTPVGDDDVLGEPGEVLELWDLGDADQRAMLGPHELAINHDVALLDRMVVIAVEARRDAEAPSPGDRVLVTRWLASDGSIADAGVLAGPGGRDLDLPRRARQWLDLGEPRPAISVRVALAFPWLIELASNGLPELGGDPGELADAAGAMLWMASADGALGSRHAFALEIDGDVARVRVLRIDRWGSPGFVETPVVDVVELPVVPSGPPSLGMVAGAPTLLVGFGVGVPAWGVRSTGESVVLDSLAELGCDAVVLGQPEADGGGESEAVLCLAAGELRVGALGVK